jgi:putative methanogenesis marker protein 8
MYALKRQNIDAAVTACDGAGTVITSSPEVVQGIGAYMNGLFYTTPVMDVMERIRENNGYVLYPEDAEINQLEGVKKAVEMGFKNVAVTVRGDEGKVIRALRDLESDLYRDFSANDGSEDNIKKEPIRIVILAICNTGIDMDSAKTIGGCADLAWACASSHVREIVGPASILQVGMKIPVFVLSKSGLDFISSYSSDALLKEKLEDADKKHYITSNKYEENSIRLNMGKFSVFLYETPSLPLSTADEPEPLI